MEFLGRFSTTYLGRVSIDARRPPAYSGAMKSLLALLFSASLALAGQVTLTTVTNVPPAPVVTITRLEEVVTNTTVVTNVAPAQMPVGTVLPVTFTPAPAERGVWVRQTVPAGLWVIEFTLLDGSWFRSHTFERHGDVLQLLVRTNAPSGDFTRCYRVVRLR